MERRLKLKSMKRVSSHRLREPTVCESEQVGAPRPRQIDFSVASENGKLVNGNTHRGDSDNTTKPVNGLEDSVPGGEEHIDHVSRVRANSNGHTKGFLNSSTNADETSGFNTMIKNAVNAFSGGGKYVSNGKLNGSNGRTSVLINSDGGKSVRKSVATSDKGVRVQMNGELRCVDFDSESDSDYSDTFDDKGVTLRLVNNNKSTHVNSNGKTKYTNGTNGIVQREHRNGVTSTILNVANKPSNGAIKSIAPKTPISKTPLTKSRSLTIDSQNSSPRLENMKKSHEMTSSVINLRKQEPQSKVNLNVGSSDGSCKTSIADGLTTEVSKCIENNLSSSLHLSRIDENGTNSIEKTNREESPDVPHFTCSYVDNQFATLGSYSPQVHKTPVYTPVYKIRHSKSDVHLSSAFTSSREPSPATIGAANSTLTSNPSGVSKTPSSTPAVAIRRTKSRHEGQIFGFKIDGFGVRKLGQRKRRPEEPSSSSPMITTNKASSKNDRGNSTQSGGESASGEAGSDASEVDGARVSTCGPAITSDYNKKNRPRKSQKDQSTPKVNGSVGSSTSGLTRSMISNGDSLYGDLTNRSPNGTASWVRGRDSKPSDTEDFDARSDTMSVYSDISGHFIPRGMNRDHQEGVELHPSLGKLSVAPNPENGGFVSTPGLDGTPVGVDPTQSNIVGVGGAFRRCVQLLRSRSAVSQRDRPNLSASPTVSAARVIIGPDTSYEKACGSDRRGSAPATPILGARPHPLRNETGGAGGGAPATNGGTPTHTRFANFFSKRSIKNLPLKRTKSVTKLERSKRGGGLLSSNHSIQSTLLSNHVNPLYHHQQQQPSTTTNQHPSPNGSSNSSSSNNFPVYHHNPHTPAHHLSNTNLGSSTSNLANGVAGSGADVLGSMAKLRSSQSHESLLATHNQQMMNTLDLTAGESVIKPLHESILGQKYCFQISSPAGTRYYSCRTSEERDKWVESLRRAVNPQADNKSRVHNAIKITIVEAKGIPPKKKYFCELLLDDALYARTSSKPKQELCFWGEQFEFKCLPAVHTVTVSLYREAEKRRKKEKQCMVGRVNIPVSTVSGRSVVEKWYTVEGSQITGAKSSGKSSSGSNKDNTPSLRIKCSFQTVHILPIDMYNEFHQFLLSSYSGICALLEPVVSVATKADVATTLVHLTQHSRSATALLADIVVAEIDRNDDAHLIFRGNSVATKAMEAFMKLVGERYLHDTLRPAIEKILLGDSDCEVDPKKVSNEAVIPKNRQNLISIVQMTWSQIIQSPMAFPPELRQCFVLFRERLQGMGKETLSDKLISASIFLRFLCPAILNPSLFNITQELPNEKATRNLTLVAKTLQTLANFTKFQGKEQFMEFMNDFIDDEQEKMKSFLRKISTRTNIDQRALEFSGEIDLGIQLSVLHTLLSECLPNMKPTTENELYYRDTLQRFIEELDYAKSQPNNDLVHCLVSRGSTGATNSTTATMVDHQRLEERRQRIHMTDNVFTYNDPTSQSKFNNYSEFHQQNNGYTYLETGGGGNEQHAASEYTEFPGHQNGMVNGPPPPHGHPSDQPSTPRSSTLPRSTYLMGSGRKPAMDLHTADDYVHYSALGVDNDDGGNAGRQVPKGPHPIGHSFSQSHIPSDSPSRMMGPGTPLQQQHVGGNHNHHRHFHNHTGRYTSSAMPGNPSQFPNTINGGQMSPHFGSHNSASGNHHQNPAVDDSLNSSHDYDQNSSGDADGNMKGSQTSISQLSNIASSGYQSFAYSQSSSPVDPVITDVTNNNNNNGNHNQKNTSALNNNNNNNNGMLSEPISVAQMPQITQVLQPPPQVAALAFNNPMYHLNNATSSPISGNKVHPSQALSHHFLINGALQQQPNSPRSYPLTHSQSSHVASYTPPASRDAPVPHNNLHHHHLQSSSLHQQCSSSLSSAQSVEDLVCARVTLSGSDDTASLVSTTSTPPQSSMELSTRLHGYNQNGNAPHQGLSQLGNTQQHHQSTNSSFKSSAPRTNPRCIPPPSWQQLQQQQQTHHHSSITNIPNVVSSSSNNKGHLEHHHSTSDLLSAASSYPHPRRTPHKNSRRQSAEFGSSRQRLAMRNNYDSTSDDTSSDERGQSHHIVRQRHTNNPSSAQNNRLSNNRGSDPKSLEEYENEILTLKRILDNLQIELKEKHSSQHTTSSASNNSSPISSCASSNTPPSPAPTSPPIPSKHSLQHQSGGGGASANGVRHHSSSSPPGSQFNSSNRGSNGAGEASRKESLAGGLNNETSSVASEESDLQTKELQNLLRKLLAVQNEKDAVIAAQKQHITSLDDTNNRLRQAYQHLTKHITVMDTGALDPETSAAVAAASAAAAAAGASTASSTADSSLECGSGKYTTGGTSSLSSDYTGSSC